MRFHLIDRIDHDEPGRGIRARKLTSASETFWEGLDDEGGPRPTEALTMPRPLVLESLCQAATWLLMRSTDYARRAALLQIAEVTWHGDVHPGDVVDLDVTVESMGDEMAVVSGEARVEERVVMQARDIMCALIAAEELEDLGATRRTGALLDRTGREP